MKNARPAIKTIRRIAVVKLSSLGDIIHALPAVHLMQTQLDATIDWVVQTEYCELVKCFSGVSSVIPFPRHALWGNIRGFISELRRDPYDLIIDLQGLFKSAFISRFLRGKFRIGPAYSREGAAMFYDAVIPAGERQRHAVEECLDVVRWLGLKAEPTAFPIRVPEMELKSASPMIAMIPMSRWPSKNWPETHFVDAARELQRRSGATIYIFGGGAVEEQTACTRMADSIGGAVVNLSGRTSIVEMASYLRAMDVVITNDSGPMHLAAALGTPIVALFGPTLPERTGPCGKTPQRILQVSEGVCIGCRSRTCSKGDVRCLAMIPPGRVVETTLELVGRSGKSS